MAHVSVIIPSFNSGAFLARAVESVLAQSFSDFEVVVVDDGSDRPPEGITGLDERIRLITQKNRGVSVARNVGVTASGAEFVAFLDHDDEWVPTKLEEQLALVAAAPDAAFWCTQFDWVRGESTLASDPAVPTYRGLLSTQTVLLSSALVRTDDYWRVGGHDPLLSQMQDWDLFLKLTMDGSKPAQSPLPLVRYHLHESNASLNYRVAAAERLSILDAHERRARRLTDAAAIVAIQRGRARTRELFAYQAIDASRGHLADSHLRAAFGHFAYAGRLDARVAGVSLAKSVGKKVSRVMPTRRHAPGHTDPM